MLPTTCCSPELPRIWSTRSTTHPTTHTSTHPFTHPPTHSSTHSSTHPFPHPASFSCSLILSSFFAIPLHVGLIAYRPQNHTIPLQTRTHKYSHVRTITQTENHEDRTSGNISPAPAAKLCNGGKQRLESQTAWKAKSTTTLFSISGVIF